MRLRATFAALLLRPLAACGGGGGGAGDTPTLTSLWGLTLRS